ncbi:MAG: lipopolysaccharide biosynthesis protein [Rhodomicrobium sp.]
MSEHRSFLSAVKWAFVGQWGDRAFSAIFTFVLAALLGPADFGLVAIGLVYLAFMQMFLDQGLVAALIRKADVQQDHCDAVFWMNLVLSLVLVVITIAMSGWWGRVNHAPQLGQLLSVMSLSIPLEGLSIVQSALLRRSLDFKSLSIRSNVSVLIGGAAGIGMAFSGFGAWSLVGQQLFRDISALVLLWRLGSWRPRLRFSWAHLRELLGFSTHNFVAQLGIFADAQAAPILLGALFGPVAVGLYRLADRLVASVVMLASSVQAVSLPEFSRVQEKPGELRRSALFCIRLGAMVTVPVLMAMAAMSRELLAVLGTQWVPASDALSILCGLGTAFVLCIFTGPLLQALGRPRQLAALEWSRTAVNIAFLGVAALLLKNATVTEQVTGIALARFVPAVFLVLPAFVGMLMYRSGISLQDIRSSLSGIFLAGLASFASVLVFRQLAAPAHLSSLALLACEAVIGGTTGLVPLFLSAPEFRGFVQRIGVLIARSGNVS